MLGIFSVYVCSRIRRCYYWVSQGEPQGPIGGEVDRLQLAPFEIARAIQASAFFLRRARNHRLTRMQLLKLLYLADRESIRQAGKPITGDAFAALEWGPVLRHTYNCIKKDHHEHHEWWKYIKSEPNGRDVVLESDPGSGQLSTFDENILDGIWTNFGHLTAKQLSKYTHQLPEYKKHEPEPKKSNAIPTEDVLEALGMSEKREKLEAEAAAQQAVRRLFSAYST